MQQAVQGINSEHIWSEVKKQYSMQYYTKKTVQK